MKLSRDQLPQLCEKIITTLPQGGVVILQGDLASGKTTFTQNFARFLNLEDAVTSPTFSLQQIYGGDLFHYDLYNYGFEKFISLGMMEELERTGYHLIEWGDEQLISLLSQAGFAYCVIKISKCEDNIRCYEVVNGK
ncbi:tRNA (adenosine(37)-N6)-threonylcarbamoyltransferase complex ATPase subunit type 1 TsaE [Sulfuricurvum sp.]|uniref:tRNA (adenosine(37)-N6)-threonylcarbamoyltransferase complex ATPase subunit type 1 TsaE n=1 Tax=Sulfuricurvum sp. TaxID=2025608 RepID=UPI0026264221|nr:tRNA (adenosine(37)-N6)-threonylcarbamoyltransferase complex ATPase subunit type 1 TsaE [Sulfuricurvum sp.]MDD4949474.1 tRNA (adenosine(37)-N6)-threonylcarbamoyltransferase complex ATPase subunit type 1 TsaE [Sulfuricurvum sp.]